MVDLELLNHWNINVFFALEFVVLYLELVLSLLFVFQVKEKFLVFSLHQVHLKRYLLYLLIISGDWFHQNWLEVDPFPLEQIINCTRRHAQQDAERGGRRVGRENVFLRARRADDLDCAARQSLSAAAPLAGAWSRRQAMKPENMGYVLRCPPKLLGENVLNWFLFALVLMFIEKFPTKFELFSMIIQT